MILHQQDEEKPVLADDNNNNNNQMASTSNQGYFSGFTSSSSSSIHISPTTNTHLMVPSSSNTNSQYNHHQLQSSSSGYDLDDDIGPSSEIYNLATGFENMIAFHNNTQSKTLMLSADKQPPSVAAVIMTAPPPPPSDLMMGASYLPIHQHKSTTNSSPYPMLLTPPPDDSTWQRNFIINNNNNNSTRSSAAALDQTSPPSSSSTTSSSYQRRPSQGLSLSLNSNTNSIGIQSFDLMRTSIHHPQQHHHHYHQQQQAVQQQQQFELLKGSKYLTSAQELLDEFCCLRPKQLTSSTHNDEDENDDDEPRKQKKKSNNDGASSSSDLCGLGVGELQKRKKRLLFMLDELDRRYKHYCSQLKAIISSFEFIAGQGAAAAYTALASKAMSRHFRSLRDGIVNQIKAHKKAISITSSDNNNNDGLSSSIPETTPRLKMLDQALRQEKALQQTSLMESHPWRPQRGLPERAVSVLRAWLFEHFLHPYPSDVDKHILSRQTGLSRGQVSNWFINARVRLWKPMVEEMYVEEIKEELHQDSSSSSLQQQQQASSSTSSATRAAYAIHNDHYHHGDDLFNRSNIAPNHHQYNSMLQKPPHEQKPSQDQLLRIIDPDQNESLSSIVNHRNRSIHNFDSRIHNSRSSGYNIKNIHDQGFTGGAFGGASMDHLDLLPYDHNQNLSSSNVDMVQTTNFGLAASGHQIEGSRSGNVSLTLGLQQQNNGKTTGGVSLAFPHEQGSFFYNRDDHHQHLHGGHDRMEVHRGEGEGTPQVHQQQYNVSLLDDDEAVGQQGHSSNLPYRDLLGAQLLQDFGS